MGSQRVAAGRVRVKGTEKGWLQRVMRVRSLSNSKAHAVFKLGSSLHVQLFIITMNKKKKSLVEQKYSYLSDDFSVVETLLHRVKRHKSEQ